jgi:peptide deformylase
MEIIVRKIDNDEVYLRQVSKEVDFDDDSYLKDIELLNEYCSNSNILALASIQIGIPKRIIYLKNTDVDRPLDESINESRILINPVITRRIGLTKYWEACASCLDNIGLVSRPYEIEILYKDMNNILHQETFVGFPSTVLSHEMDHLDGILHIDIAEEIFNMTREERIEFRKYHGYQILSKNGDFNDNLKTQMKIKKH